MKRRADSHIFIGRRDVSEFSLTVGDIADRLSPLAAMTIIVLLSLSLWAVIWMLCAGLADLVALITGN